MYTCAKQIPANKKLICEEWLRNTIKSTLHREVYENFSNISVYAVCAVQLIIPKMNKSAQKKREIKLKQKAKIL